MDKMPYYDLTYQPVKPIYDEVNLLVNECAIENSYCLYKEKAMQKSRLKSDELYHRLVEALKYSVEYPYSVNHKLV